MSHNHVIIPGIPITLESSDGGSGTGGYIPYVGAAYDVNLGTHNLTTTGTGSLGALQLNLSPTATSGTGMLKWNSQDQTADLQLNQDVVLQIGQETLVKVVNKTGTAITDGTAVMISGAVGQRPKAILAKGDSETTARFAGLTTQHIANNQEGFVTVRGLVRGIDTSGTPYSETWADGDTLWVSKTIAGGMTNVEPAEPHHSDIVGHVVNANPANGSILVMSRAHKALEDLSDVDGTALTTTGQIPVWNQTTGYFDFNYNVNALDHGTLTGLSDDDHVDYFRIGTTRTFSGDLGLGINQTTTISNNDYDYMNHIITEANFDVTNSAYSQAYGLYLDFYANGSIDSTTNCTAVTQPFLLTNNSGITFMNGNHTVYNRAFGFTAQPNNNIWYGSLNVINQGMFINVIERTYTGEGGTATVNNYLYYGQYKDVAGAPRGSNYSLYVYDESSSPCPMHIYTGRDNSKIYLGEGTGTNRALNYTGDAAIYYNGTNLVINPKEVGTGYLSLLGDLYNVNTVSSGYNSCDNFTKTNHYTGFPDRTSTSLSWNDANATLTLTATSDPIWINGVSYTINTLTKAFDAGLAEASGLYWFYITAPAGVPQLNYATSVSDQFGQCLVATVYWNTTTNKGLLCDERHWMGRDKWMHEYLHETVGARYYTGLTGTFANTTFSITAGEFYDEDIEHHLSSDSPMDYPGTAMTTCKVLYHNGDADWAWDAASTTPYKITTGNLRFNTGNTLSTAAANKYVNYWVFASAGVAEPIWVVIGTAEYNTIADARAATVPSLGTLPSPETKLIYKVIYKNDGTPTFQEAIDYRATAVIGSTFTPTDHATLTNLSFSTSGHSGDLNIGNYTFTGTGFVSTTLTGTKPITVASTTVCTNLNADLWDGYQFSDYLDQAVKVASTPTFAGLKVDATVDHQITNSSDDLNFINGNSNKAIYFNINKGGTTHNFVKIDGSAPQFLVTNGSSTNISDGIMKVSGTWSTGIAASAMAFGPTIASGNWFGFLVNPVINTAGSFTTLSFNPSFGSNNRTVGMLNFVPSAHTKNYNDTYNRYTETFTRSFTAFSAGTADSSTVTYNPITLGGEIAEIDTGYAVPNITETMISLNGGTIKSGTNGSITQKGLTFTNFGSIGTNTIVRAMEADGGLFSHKYDYTTTSRLLFGAGEDAAIGYDGTNLIIDPKLVGTGYVDILGKCNADNFVSDIATGTAPYACTSTTLNTNLNADLHDGVHIDSLTNTRLLRYNSTGTKIENATVTETSGALGGITTISMNNQLTNSLATGTSPFAITSTTVNTNLNADLVDGIHGFGYALQFSAAQFAPADGSTYYIGSHAGLAPVAGSKNISRVYIPKAGTVKYCYIDFSNGTTGTNEASTVSFRLNDTTDTTISDAVTNDSANTTFNNTSLSISVAAGDYFEIKWVCPTWVTNPTKVNVHGTIYIE